MEQTIQTIHQNTKQESVSKTKQEMYAVEDKTIFIS
jgi:hypothetical protein